MRSGARPLRYFLDTEYNGWGGSLLSLALVPDEGEELYLTLDWTGALEPWVGRFCDAVIDTRAADLVRATSYRDALRLFAEVSEGFVGSVDSEEQALAHLCPRGCPAEHATVFDWGWGAGVLIPTADDDAPLVLPWVAGAPNPRCPGPKTVMAVRRGELIHVRADWEELVVEYGSGYSHCGSGPRLTRDLLVELATGDIELDLTRAADTIDVELGLDRVSLHGCDETLELRWTHGAPNLN